MKKILREKLWDHIIAYNPDLMFDLQENYSALKYLDDKVEGVSLFIEELSADGKPEYIIEELCMQRLTEDLRPSKYLYIKGIIDEEFEDDEAVMRESGTLTYEILNMIKSCSAVFDHFGFSIENEDNRFMRYAVIGELHSYLHTRRTVEVG